MAEAAGNDKKESAKFALKQWDNYTKELAVIQSLDKSANIEMAADWALIGQKQFDEDKFSESARSFVQAIYLLELAKKSCRVRNRIMGWFCVVLQLVYLLILIGVPYLVGRSFEPSEITKLCEQQLNEHTSCSAVQPQWVASLTDGAMTLSHDASAQTDEITPQPQEDAVQTDDPVLQPQEVTAQTDEITPQPQEEDNQQAPDIDNLFWIGIVCQECDLEPGYVNFWLKYMAGEMLLRRLHVFRIPLIFFAGGFLGGIAWCMHNGISWMGKRLFDLHSVIWYFAHPFVSTILGGIISFLFLSGLITLTGAENVDYHGSEIYDPTLFATIMLFSFGAGFSAKYIWQKLDSLVRKILGIEEASSVFHDRVLKDVAQSPTK